MSWIKKLLPQADENLPYKINELKTVVWGDGSGLTGQKLRQLDSGISSQRKKYIMHWLNADAKSKSEQVLSEFDDIFSLFQELEKLLLLYLEVLTTLARCPFWTFNRIESASVWMEETIWPDIEELAVKIAVDPLGAVYEIKQGELEKRLRIFINSLESVSGELPNCLNYLEDLSRSKYSFFPTSLSKYYSEVTRGAISKLKLHWRETNCLAPILEPQAKELESNYNLFMALEAAYQVIANESDQHHLIVFLMVLILELEKKSDEARELANLIVQNDPVVGEIATRIVESRTQTFKEVRNSGRPMLAGELEVLFEDGSATLSLNQVAIEDLIDRLPYGGNLDFMSVEVNAKTIGRVLKKIRFATAKKLREIRSVSVETHHGLLEFNRYCDRFRQLTPLSQKVMVITDLRGLIPSQKILLVGSLLLHANYLLNQVNASNLLYPEDSCYSTQVWLKYREQLLQSTEGVDIEDQLCSNLNRFFLHNEEIVDRLKFYRLAERLKRRWTGLGLLDFFPTRPTLSTHREKIETCRSQIDLLINNCFI